MSQSAPKPPDYTGAAEATAAADREAARYATYANRVNQYTPWGSLTFDPYQGVDPETGQAVTRWEQHLNLDPEAQAALDAQLAVQRGRSELAGSMLGDISQDYGERMDFDRFGQPIGMGEQGRLSGAGEGISTRLGNLGRANTNVRRTFDFDDPGLRGQTLETDLDYTGAPNVNAPEWTREMAEQSVYERGASRLDPQFAQEEQALDVRLRSQGLTPGDEAYDAQMRNFQDRKTDAYDALQAQAMQEGARQAESMFGMESRFRDQATGEEDRMMQFRNAALAGQFGIDAQRQAQLFDIARQTGLFGQRGDIAAGQMGLQARGQDLQRAIAQGQLDLQGQAQNWQQQMQQLGYNTDQAYRENALANALRTQAMNEAMQQRGYRLNELNALLSGQQVNAPQFSQYAQQGQTRGPDYLGAADLGYQADMARYGAQQAPLNSALGGLGMMGGMWAGAGFPIFSDRRLKRNIRSVGERNGINWYAYEIFGRPQIGVMAQEVPWAAIEHPSGYLMVDYSKV